MWHWQRTPGLEGEIGQMDEGGNPRQPLSSLSLLVPDATHWAILYDKNEMDDLGPTEKRALRAMLKLELDARR